MTLNHAETAFAFLSAYGFELIDRFVTDGESFKDGWRLMYASPGVHVAVEYLDVEFDVRLTRGGRPVSYFALDRVLFGGRSGFHGQMFPMEKLGLVIDRVALDMKNHYEPLLRSDSDAWKEAERRLHAEPPPGRRTLPA
jgi:hypothetical protein